MPALTSAHPPSPLRHGSIEAGQEELPAALPAPPCSSEKPFPPVAPPPPKLWGTHTDLFFKEHGEAAAGKLGWEKQNPDAPGVGREKRGGGGEGVQTLAHAAAAPAPSPTVPPPLVLPQRGAGPGRDPPAPSWRSDPTRSGHSGPSPAAQGQGAPGWGAGRGLPQNTHPARQGCLEAA